MYVFPCSFCFSSICGNCVKNAVSYVFNHKTCCIYIKFEYLFFQDLMSILVTIVNIFGYFLACCANKFNIVIETSYWLNIIDRDFPWKNYMHSFIIHIQNWLYKNAFCSVMGVKGCARFHPPIGVLENKH